MVPLVEAAESAEHKRLVQALVNDLRDLGFKITCADYVGYDRCSEISKHIPDVEGQNADGLIVIGEAKTFDDLDNDRAREQFKAFSNCTMNGGKFNGQAVQFYIAITAGHENELLAALHNLGLDGRTNIHRVSF